QNPAAGIAEGFCALPEPEENASRWLSRLSVGAVRDAVIRHAEDMRAVRAAAEAIAGACADAAAARGCRAEIAGVAALLAARGDAGAVLVRALPGEIERWRTRG